MDTVLHELRRHATVCGGVAWVIGLLCSASVSSARVVTEVATLTADRRTFVFHPTAGEVVQGGHDELGLTPSARDTLRAVFDDSGLISGGRLIAPESLYVVTQVSDPTHVTLSFVTSDSLPLGGTSLRWRVRQTVDVGAEEFWPGALFVFDGTVSIRGEVGGDVIAVGADVTIGEAATVRGAVVVIGGILRQRGDAKIYGPVFAPGGHRRPRLSVTRAWEFEERGFHWAPTFSYDRVDGARPGVTLDVKRSPYTPHLGLAGAYAVASETWQYKLDIRQRLSRKIDLTASVTIFRLTRTDDEYWVGRTPNTVYALVVGSDFRDYYGADGGGVSLTYKYRERGVLSVTYENADYRPLEAHPELWHLFRPDRDFRENFSTLDVAARELLPEALAGRNRAVTLKLAVEPIQAGRPESGFNGAGSVALETAGGGLGGDYEYDRWTMQVKGWWKNGWSHRAAVRAFYGICRHDPPPNKLFYLGGVGSLPGYSQKVLYGDEAFLLNLEYRFNYWATRMFDGGVILFFDVGRAAPSRRFWELNEFKPDIGLGMALGEEFRLDVAKGLDHSDREFRVRLLVGDSF
ncbi:MAG: hypothetical protein AB1792_11995 [Candidatus Zixiibacteriota bacterium]